MSKIRVYEVKPNNKGSIWCSEREADGVLGWLEIAPIGDSFVIYVKEMEEEEYNKLPEFEGF